VFRSFSSELPEIKVEFVCFDIFINMKKKNREFLLHKVPSDYDKVSETFSNSRNKAWAEFELYSSACFKGARVLDLGCGNGRLYFSLQDKGIDYIGVDNSKGLLQQAELNLKSCEVSLKQGDLLDIPLEEKSVDLVFAVASFHHIPSRELRLKALLEMERVLVPSGRVFISVWNLFQVKYLKYVLLSVFRLGSYDLGDTFIKLGGVERYYHAFTPWGIKRLLARSNFDVLKLHYYKNSQKVDSFWESQNMVLELGLRE